jgi:Tfp pilus assembly protein PilF
MPSRFQEAQVATLIKRSIVSISLVAFVALAAAVGSAQQAQPGKPQGAAAAKPQTPPAPAPAPPATPPAPPDRTALNAAMAIKEPDAKLAALEKIRTDFPQATSLATVDAQILITLVTNFADRTADINTVFDRILGRIPADATPENRLTSTLGPVSTVVGKRVLLDRSEKLVTEGLAALDLERYVQTLTDTATKANRKPQPRAALESNFNSIRGRGLEQLARINMAMAEENFKAAIKANPAFGTAQPALVELYMAKGDPKSAEAVLQDAIKASTTSAMASRPTMALVDFYTKRGDAAAAEALLVDALKADPTLKTALLALARIENKRGDSAPALAHFMTAAAAGSLASADNKAMHELYTKVHGSDAGFDDDLDKIYAEKYPNPVKPEKYTPAAPTKGNRMVLLEMFTGSGCGPCVSADLAFDAVMQRYPANMIVPVAYHQNIPAPDPMVVASGNDRREYYKINGVPTFNIDGTLGELGGGARSNAPSNYKNYIEKIDKELAVPAQAVISLDAVGEGDLINVTATVSKLPAKATDLKLHILLVEKELRFMGENGIRFHPMAVRALAGEKGAGIPITANGKTKYTFNLATIREDLVNTLQADIERRRKGAPAGATPAEYAAEGHAYTSINLGELSVVAFVQQGAYTPPPPAAGSMQATLDAAAAGAPVAAPAGSTVVNPAASGRAGAPPANGAGANQNAAAKPATPAALPINVLQATRVDVVYPAPASKGKGGK